MTSFTISWNDEGQNRRAPRMLSRGLDRCPAASKAPSTFLDRPPTISGKNPLSVLAPIGSGDGGKMVGKKGECREKKDRGKGGKTTSRCKKGEIKPNDLGHPAPNVLTSLPARPVPQFSRFAVLDKIKKPSQPATRQAPQLHDSSENRARVTPSQTADRGQVRGKTQAGRRGAPRENTVIGRKSSSGSMTKRHEDTAEAIRKQPAQTAEAMRKRPAQTTGAMTKRPTQTAEGVRKRLTQTAEAMRKRPSQTTGAMTKRHGKTAEAMTKRPTQTSGAMTKRQGKTAEAMSKQTEQMGNAMTKRIGQTAEVMTRRTRKTAETGKDDKRQHESLGERVRNLLSSRSQERDRGKMYMVQKPARGDADSSSSIGEIKTGRDLNDEDQPIRTNDIALNIPHPPACLHVILSRLVFEYRKRRFTFASLRLRN